MDLMILAPLGMLVVMGLLAAIGLPGSRRSSETPPAQPARRPGAAGAPQLPPAPPGYQYARLADGRPILVPTGGAR
jgi:hypothetical protein